MCSLARPGTSRPNPQHARRVSGSCTSALLQRGRRNARCLTPSLSGAKRRAKLPNRLKNNPKQEEEKTSPASRPLEPITPISANAIRDIGVENFARMNIKRVWVESKLHCYDKNKNIDMADLVGSLQNYGIAVILDHIPFEDYHGQTRIWFSHPRLRPRTHVNY